MATAFWNIATVGFIRAISDLELNTGFGVYTSASDFRYEGGWSDGEQTGSAKISYKMATGMKAQ